MRQSMPDFAQSRCSINDNTQPPQKPVELHEQGSSGRVLGVLARTIPP